MKSSFATRCVSELRAEVEAGPLSNVLEMCGGVTLVTAGGDSRNHMLRWPLLATGITFLGARLVTFLKANTTMKSRDYCELILRDAKPMMDHLGLTILHDRRKVHDCKYSFNFFKKNHIKTKLMPAKNPDLNVIEHVLGLLKRKLVKKPTRSLKVL